MKTSLPSDHGLPEALLAHEEFLFREDGTYSLTDVQWKALEVGVARGRSALFLAPTSTGKTQIGIWALSSWLASDNAQRRALYLVTHRSLANQKFEEFQRILREPLFSDSGDAMVLSTGDRQVDADGASVNDPLRASLLVATYEKYLGLLCGSGIPNDLGNMCIVVDEVQIIGDRYRGMDIEALLTLIRRANPGQLIGLSAVLDKTDGQNLAEWLGVELVRVPQREKHLLYECRTPSKRFTFHTETSGSDIHEETRDPDQATEIHSLVRECWDTGNGRPIVVFCMRKQDVYDGCRAYCQSIGIDIDGGAPLLAGLSDDTYEAELLSVTLPQRIAIHCADLLEEDRLKVENEIKNSRIDLVFATSTLAAGVNFPLGTVIFFSWKRWNSERRIHEPISAGEFHNMAGRCGRMGTDHEAGHVIFLADDRYHDQAVVGTFLPPDQFDHLKSQINPKYFAPLVLQLAASGVVSDEGDALNFLKATFGASQESQANVAGLAHWDTPFQEAVNILRDWKFLR